VRVMAAKLLPKEVLLLLKTYDFTLCQASAPQDSSFRCKAACII